MKHVCNKCGAVFPLAADLEHHVKKHLLEMAGLGGPLVTDSEPPDRIADALESIAKSLEKLANPLIEVKYTPSHPDMGKLEATIDAIREGAATLEAEDSHLNRTCPSPVDGGCFLSGKPTSDLKCYDCGTETVLIKQDAS